MKNRPRPHIPLAIRVQVAQRQLKDRDGHLVAHRPEQSRLAILLGDCLFALFAMQPVALDHNPPLRARTYNPRIKNVAARYTPNANDPDHLIYRTVTDHKLKTNVRGDGAQFPDRVLIKRERKREKKATPPPNRLIAKTWHLHPCRWCGRIHANGCPRKWPSRSIQNRPFPKSGVKKHARLSRASRTQKARRKEMPQARIRTVLTP